MWSELTNHLLLWGKNELIIMTFFQSSFCMDHGCDILLLFFPLCRHDVLFFFYLGLYSLPHMLPEMSLSLYVIADIRLNYRYEKRLHLSSSLHSMLSWNAEYLIFCSKVYYQCVKHAVNSKRKMFYCLSHTDSVILYIYPVNYITTFYIFYCNFMTCIS